MAEDLHPEAAPGEASEAPDTASAAAEQTQSASQREHPKHQKHPKVKTTTAAKAPPKGEAITTPNKVLRINAMLRKVLTELLQAPLELQTRQELADTYVQAHKLIKKCLSPDLQKELKTLVPNLKTGKHHPAPSDAELRLAYAQLVGWLEGLAGGIQTLLAVQQNSQAQIGGIRASVVPGTIVATTNAAAKEATSKAVTDAASFETDLRPGQYL